MYLYSLFYIFLQKSSKKAFDFFIFLVILAVWLNFFKNTAYSLLEINKFNNFFWDYVLILNNNNRSVLLFLAVFILFNYLKNGYKSGYKITFYWYVLYFYSIENTIQKCCTIFKENLEINTNLTNGLIIVHPICIYITYLFFIIFFKKKFKKNLDLIDKWNYIIFCLFFSFLAIFLGSYWSQQELNWGGWWNWDFVEMVALIFFLSSIFISHLNIKKNFNFISFSFYRVMNYFFLFFFLIRLDFINSIHSFNVFSKSNFSLNLISLVYIIFIVIIIVINNNNYNKYINNNIKNNNILILLFLMLLLIINIYIYINVLYSFFYDTQYIELTKYLKKLINTIIFLYFINIIKNIKLLLIAIFIAINNNLIFFIIFINIIIIKIINNYKYNYKNNYHIFIIIFIIINNFYYNYIYYLLNLHLINLNVNLINNINTLDNYKNYLMCLYYYNNNNYLYNINNYYCYNNNILFNNVFNETLLNNILLYKNNTNIIYLIEKNAIFSNLFKFGNIIILIYFIIISNYFFFFHKKKNNYKIV